MKIRIADRTLCNKERTFSFKEKLEIARQLEKLHVNIIELPEIENVKADSLLIKTLSSFLKNSVISVCVGADRQSMANAIAALSATEKPRICIEVPVSTVGMEYKYHLKAAKMQELLRELIKEAKANFCHVEFCAADATRAEWEVLSALINEAVAGGVSGVTVCDDAAEMTPDEFSDFVGRVKALLPEDVKLGISAENRNGLAAANAVMGIKNGAQIVKTVIEGSGIQLMDVANIMRNCSISRSVSSDMEYTVLNRTLKQANWIIGNSGGEKTNVRAAETEAHEIDLDSADTEQDVTTAVLKLGYDLSEEDNAKVYEEFLRVANKKQVGAKELDAIVASVALQVKPTYKLVSYVINNGNIISASAQIILEKDGERLQGICIGDGPIDAAFLTIEQITGCHCELDDFQIQSVTQGTEAMGSALVKLRYGGKVYPGNGISTDIVDASIRAYISAVNKIV